MLCLLFGRTPRYWLISPHMGHATGHYALWKEDLKALANTDGRWSICLFHAHMATMTIYPCTHMLHNIILTSCNVRFNRLNPSLRKGDPWTREEEDILLQVRGSGVVFFNSSLMPCCAQGQQELGTAWKKIAKRLPGRGGYDCNSHFNCTSSMKRLRLAAGADSACSDIEKTIAKSSDVDNDLENDGNTDVDDALPSAHSNTINAETTSDCSGHGHIGSGEGTSSSSSSSSPRAQAQSCAAASLGPSAVRREWTPGEVREEEKVEGRRGGAVGLSCDLMQCHFLSVIRWQVTLADIKCRILCHPVTHCFTHIITTNSARFSNMNVN